LKIQGVFAAGVSLAQRGDGLARIVIAVVQEKDNLAADFLLQPARARDFGVKKSFGEKSARLLAEADDRRAHALRKIVR
jgi:hypothetical protein